MRAVEHKSIFGYTKHTSYLAHTGVCLLRGFWMELAALKRHRTVYRQKPKRWPFEQNDVEQRRGFFNNRQFLKIKRVCRSFNPSLTGQNGRQFAEDIFKCIFMNKKFCISIRISLKFVPKGPIDDKSALVHWSNRRQAITWTNADPVHRRIYAALGGDELSPYLIDSRWGSRVLIDTMPRCVKY